MQRFQDFQTFVTEEEVQLSPELDDFTVQNEGDGKFSMEDDGAPVNFTVLPLPADVEEYRKAFEELSTVVENGRPVEMYDTLLKLQNMAYEFGNVVPASLSLQNVPSLSMGLSDEQRELLKKSSHDFLSTQFSSLSKELKGAILLYLKKTAQLYAIVLECMFYYIRTQKTDETQ